MAVAPSRQTLEEFLKLPDVKPALECFDGVVAQKVLPRGRHSRLQGKRVCLLNGSAQHGEEAWALLELRTILAGSAVVPDVSVYQHERIPADANGDIAGEFTGPPDLTIEIVSPEQCVDGLVRRCLWYVANGVQVDMLVDPSNTSALVYRLGKQTVALRGSGRIDLHEVLPDFELTVDQLFASLRHS